MTTVVWLTDSTELLPSIQLTVSLLNAQLVLITDPESVPDNAIDLLIWSPASLDKARYEQIREWCVRIVICIPRSTTVSRWYSRGDFRWPDYFVVTPFAADELAVILRGVLSR